jgi:hypothetical protein
MVCGVIEWSWTEVWWVGDVHSAAPSSSESGDRALGELLPLDHRHFCPTFSEREQHPHASLLENHTPNITMAGKYELLCLENPLLDIQGVAYVIPRSNMLAGSNCCMGIP